ncbi:MAG: septum formation protein Maf [candidate division Zixibacteria bacterium]|nr:septum formation protein Maf [candidate division Zixibacteria bacterium]
MKVVLASSSPRRFKLLSEEGFEFKVVPPEIDETKIGDELPEDYVCRLARSKAQAIDNGDSLVIGADTVVVLGDEFLNKPASKLEARVTLEKLSGQTHVVYTGLCLVCSNCGRTNVDYDKTTVHFNVLTNSAILEYIESGEPLDKAGAYGIQGMGAFLVNKIDGHLDTVIGFPMSLLRKMLEGHRECLKKV